MKKVLFACIPLIVVFVVLICNIRQPESPIAYPSETNTCSRAAPEYRFIGPALQFGEATDLVASWYGPGFHGRRMSNGKQFDQEMFTVAHRTLLFGTLLFLENTKTGLACFAVVADRGPYYYDRQIDVSLGVARALGMEADGLAVLKVREAR